MADFVKVVYRWYSLSDELWEIWLDMDPPKVELGPICLEYEGCDEEIIEIYGERLGKRILKAIEDDDIVEIKGEQALKILKAIDDYMYEWNGLETNYLEMADDLLVFKIKV
jgi:hypothetical protein